MHNDVSMILCICGIHNIYVILLYGIQFNVIIRNE